MNIQKKTSSPDLEIIILNFNTRFWLKKTLLTLKEFFLDRSKFKICVTVVDNNSSDNSVGMIVSDFPWVSLIKSPKNNGFASGNNLALAQTQAKYVMLLNSDIEFNSKSNLDPLLDYLNTKKEVGIITPKVILPTGQLDPASHRGEPTLWASLTYFLALEKLFPNSQLFGEYHQYYKLSTVPHLIDACSGAAMIVRVSAIKKVGLLDERFFMYAEDLDWCKRFRDLEYLVVFHPAVTVIHHKYKSGIESDSKKIARKTNLHFYDTMLQYYDKHYSKKYPKIFRFFVKSLIQLRKGVQ
jgi:GT2 family glycosyltransferase